MSFATVKDLVLLAFAAFGSWVAYQGLQTWKRQLRGQADYDLARRLALAVFKWREAVRRVRRSFVGAPEELPSSSEDADKAPMRIAYEARWTAHAAAAAELDAIALEAEALWGAEARTPFALIRDVQMRLGNALNNYLLLDEASKRRGPIPESERPGWISNMKEIEKIIYARPDVDDDFWREVVAAIKGIEDLLAPHLGRRD